MTIPRNKTIPRVRATPRLIREIKPKRQLPRSNNNNQTEGDDDWWGQSSNNDGIETSPVSDPLSPNGMGTRQRFHKEDDNEHFDDEDPKNHSKIWKNLAKERWERYKRTPFRKKMRQFFWICIMFQSMKMIFMADLSSGKVQTQMQSGYYTSSISSKTMSKSFLNEEDRKEASLFSGLDRDSSSLNKFDGLGNDDISGKSGLSNEFKLKLGSSQPFGSGSIKASDSLYGSNTLQGFSAGNTAQTNSYSNGLGSSGSGSLMKSYVDGQPIQGFSGSNLRHPSGNSPLTGSYGASDKFGSSGSDKYMSSYGNSPGALSGNAAVKPLSADDNNMLSRSDFVNTLGNPQSQQGIYAGSGNSIGSLRGNSALSDSIGAAGNIGLSESDSFANSFGSSRSQQKSYASSVSNGNLDLTNSFSASNNQGVFNGNIGITDSFAASNKLSLAAGSDTLKFKSYDNYLSKTNTFGAANMPGSSDTLMHSFGNTLGNSFGGLSRLESAGPGISKNSYGNPAPQMKSLSISEGLGSDRFSALSDSYDHSLSQTKSFDASRLGEPFGNSLLQTKTFDPPGRLGSADDTLQANPLSVDRAASFRDFQPDLNPLTNSLGAKPVTELKKDAFTSDTDLRVDEKSNNSLNQQSSIAGLNCGLHGGPSQKDSNELIYWRDIPSDASFNSMFYSPKSQEQSYDESNPFWKTKYLTFEMDNGGWNNMRLGVENVVLIAHAMGRTLVMPPKRQLAHGLRDSKGTKVVSFSDFYDIIAISAEQSGLNIISMEQFLAREAMHGNLQGKYPPENRLKWDNEPLHPLWDYIANVSYVFDWHPEECVLAFPGRGSDGQDLLSMMDVIVNERDGRLFPNPSDFQGKPTRVDAPAMERLREALGERKYMCLYDKDTHAAHDVVHFRAHESDGHRLIIQFNAFLWFEDWRQDLWAKRFVRDHLRYRDEIMCLAARVVTALRAHARQRDPSNVHGYYDAVHIRRTDFQSQFPLTNLTADETLAQIQETVGVGSTLFIATDEKDQTFFHRIESLYDVKYLGHFSDQISAINPNYFALVEQIVASRSRVFIGTYYSTFSSFITRLRGYYSVQERQEGYDSGALRDTYYLSPEFKNTMRIYKPVHYPYWGREFPSAWRDIDHLELPDWSQT